MDGRDWILEGTLLVRENVIYGAFVNSTRFTELNLGRSRIF